MGQNIFLEIISLNGTKKKHKDKFVNDIINLIIWILFWNGTEKKEKEKRKSRAFSAVYGSGKEGRCGPLDYDYDYEAASSWHKNWVNKDDRPWYAIQRCSLMLWITPTRTHWSSRDKENSMAKKLSAPNAVNHGSRRRSAAQTPTATSFFINHVSTILLKSTPPSIPISTNVLFLLATAKSLATVRPETLWQILQVQRMQFFDRPAMRHCRPKSQWFTTGKRHGTTVSIFRPSPSTDLSPTSTEEQIHKTGLRCLPTTYNTRFSLLLLLSI